LIFVGSRNDFLNMVKFETDITKYLPYDRNQYQDYYDLDLEDLIPAIHWYGISIQLEIIRDQKLYQVSDDVVKKAIDLLEVAFKLIIFELVEKNSW